jgi:outer membrane protein assembly factor BamB
MKIKHLSILIALAALGLLLSACTGSGGATNSWGGALLTDSNIYFADVGQVYGLRDNGIIAWQYPAKTSPTRLFFAAPVLVGEQLIVGDYANLLTSLSTRDGVENWQFSEAKGKYIDSPLIIEDTIVAPNADSHLYALDLSGKLKWSFKADHAFWAQPVSDGKTAFAPSMDHSLYAVDLSTGNLVWKVDLNAALVARPILVDGIIYLGNLDGGFYAVDSTNGKIVWNQKIAGGVWAAPLFTEGQLYFGDQTGKVNILKALDGTIVMSIDAGSAILGSGAILPEGVAFGTENGELMVFGLNGDKKWPRTIDGSLYSNLIVNGERLLVVATKGVNPLVMMDLKGNNDPNFNFSTKK